MTGTTTLELPRQTGSAGIARLIMTAHGASLDVEQRKSANLMVSELVTNAFRHGQGRIELTVSSDADGVRAEVHDEGDGASIATPEPRPERGGWGLYFVDRLADLVGRRARPGARLVHGRLTLSAFRTRLRCVALPPETTSQPGPTRRTASRDVDGSGGAGACRSRALSSTAARKRRPPMR